MTKQAILNKFQRLPADIQLQVLDYIEFLLGKYQERTVEKNNMQASEEKTDYLLPAEKDIPERLKIAIKFEGAAPYPDVPISKYDYYEQ